jgi:maltose/moltooligosaccharide transporter
MSFGQIWNMCFGFLGIQIGFALQNANTSRIFQTLGAEVDKLPLLWIAAPATGLLIQPLIGHMSDKTWGRLGRRRPYFLVGAILTTLALLFMPNAPYLWMAAGTLWIMDASINITMEPFRAFVGDLLPEEQRSAGFAMQSFFIGVGAVFASALPWMLSHWFGVSNTAPQGQIPPSVRIAFFVGAFGLLSAVLWTVFNTKEYSPDEMAAFTKAEGAAVEQVHAEPHPVNTYYTYGLACIAGGAVIAAAVAAMGLDQQLFVLAGLIGGFGLAQIGAGALRQAGKASHGLTEVVDDLYDMPQVMKGLAVVQFFSWFGLFAMWIYTTSAVTSFHYGVHDTTSKAYNEGADWVDLLFGVYNGVAALAAFALPQLAARIGRKQTHALALIAGGIGLSSFLVIRDPGLLWVSMIGVGVAWCSILSAPYSILSGSAPPQKMGVYMGIFNIFIVAPQLLAATVLGVLVKRLLGGQPIYALLIGGVSFACAAIAVMLINDAADPLLKARKQTASQS